MGSVIVAAAGVAPVVAAATDAQLRWNRGYALAASSTSATNPPTYLQDVAAALKTANVDGFDLLTKVPVEVLTAEVDTSTGAFSAVEQIDTTTQAYQNLAQALVGGSSSSTAQSVVASIGSAGSTLATDAGALITSTESATRPFAYLAGVLNAGGAFLLAVVLLPSHVTTAVLSGADPRPALQAVATAWQNVLTALRGGSTPTTTAATTTATATATTTPTATAVVNALSATPRALDVATPSTATGKTESVKAGTDKETSDNSAGIKGPTAKAFFDKIDKVDKTGKPGRTGKR